MSLESDRRTAADQSARAEVEGVWTGVVTGPDDLWPETEPRRGAHAAVSGSAAAKAVETQAYEDAVKKAFGGKRGMADVGIPALIFLVIYTATKDLNPALWASVGVAALLTVVRLLRKETLQHALSGLFGVVVCAALAKWTGRPENYYLPGLLLNYGYGAVCIVTAAIRWPIVGLMLGPITGEMLAWRQVPGRLKAFTSATWVLAGMFVLRVAVQTPLWLAGQTTALGITRLVLGYPVYIAALYFCWQIIKQAPPPVKPQADAEADTGSAVEAGSGRAEA